MIRENVLVKVKTYLFGVCSRDIESEHQYVWGGSFNLHWFPEDASSFSRYAVLRLINIEEKHQRGGSLMLASTLLEKIEYSSCFKNPLHFIGLWNLCSFCCNIGHPGDCIGGILQHSDLWRFILQNSERNIKTCPFISRILPSTWLIWGTQYFCS